MCLYTKRLWFLGRLDTAQKTLERFELPYTTFDDVHVHQSNIICTASSPSDPTALIQIDAGSHAVTVLRRSVDFSLDPRYLSVPSPSPIRPGTDRPGMRFITPRTMRIFKPRPQSALPSLSKAMEARPAPLPRRST